MCLLAVSCWQGRRPFFAAALSAVHCQQTPTGTHTHLSVRQLPADRLPLVKTAANQSAGSSQQDLLCKSVAVPLLAVACWGPLLH